MKSLPLYTDNDPSCLETVAGQPVNPGCTKCYLHRGARSVCIPADGEPGGLLVIGEGPVEEADKAGRPFVGRGGILVREAVQRFWKGPVVFDNATRCIRGAGPLTDTSINACRSYLAQTFQEAAPTRIIAMGSGAIQSVLDRFVPVMSARRGFAWAHHPAVDQPIPVFLLMRPAAALNNRILKKLFLSDLRHALTTTPPEPPPYNTKFHLIETREDAERAATALKEAGAFTYDVESAGLHFSDYFEIVTVAAVPVDSDEAFVWERDQCNDPYLIEPFLDVAADPSIGKTGQNLKFDNKSIRCRYGVQVRGTMGDTRLERKLLEAHVNSSLAVVAELVGMGGHKGEMKDALTNARRAVSRARSRSKKSNQTFLVGVEDPAIEAAVRHSGANVDAFAYGLVDPIVRRRYCARDAVATVRVHRLQRPRIDSMPPMRNVFHKVVSKATDAIEQIESWGIAADRGAIEVFGMHLETELAKIEREMRRYGDINFGSPDQLAELLFVKLGLTPLEFSESSGKPSTKNSVLQQLKGRHPFVDLLVEHRRLSKLHSAYGKPMAGHIRIDGRIHPSFKIDGTECMPAGELVHTGRGVIPVEQVRVGDHVITHKGRARRVTRTQVFAPTPIHTVKAGQHELRTSANHQYWTPEGWIRADALCRGASIYTANSEAWRPIAEWPYEVSSWGRVRRVGRAPLALQPKNRWGHLKITLSRNGAQSRGPDLKDFPVHRLVADAFDVGGAGPEVRHINGIAWDNRASNLMWGTRLQNAADAVNHGTMAKRGVSAKLTQAQVDLMRNTERPPHGGRGRWKQSNDTWVSDSEFAAQFGGSRELVRDVRSGKRWQAVEPKVTDPDWLCVEVSEVKVSTPEVVYGLTVEEDASHLTAGIVTHNTGRLSCLDPNLQQIPRAESAEGRMIKDCFVAPPGHLLCQLDFSQLELRIAAMLSGDEVMKQLFLSGQDFHMGTAKLIAPVYWKIRPEECKKEHRSFAKAFNFGLLYGMTDGGLASRLQCSRSEAERLREAILGKFFKLAAWIEERQKETRETGLAWTQWDGERARRRWLWKIHSRNDGERINAENSAVNSPVQGTASEYMLASLTQLVPWIINEALPAKLVLTVHDSAIFEVREDALDEVALGAREIMMSHESHGVPLKVDVEYGRSWGSLKEYKVAA